MTVSSKTSTATFVGNGVATAFPLPFRFFDNGDIRAYFIDSVTGAATRMVLGTDYTLIGSGEPEVDGNALSLLTTTAPLASMRGLYVERVMQQVQGTDIVNQGQFFASTHEDVFDRLTMLIQQANGNSQGAIRVAVGDPDPNRLPPAIQRANLLLGFDSQGQPTAVVPVSGSAADLALMLANNTDPARGATLVGYESGTVSDFLRAFNQQGSGNFFVEYGARIDKLRDRVFIGDAAKHNGTNITTQDDWLTIYQIAKGRSNGFVQSCQAAIETQNNLDVSNCLVLGARTSSLYDNYNAIGLISIATSNKSTGNGMAYGGYFEAYRDAGAVGGCYGFETDTMNYVGVVQTDPYQQLIGQTIGVQIAAGGEYSPTGQFPSSAAINIRKNGSTFERGIVFGADALTGASGASGSAPAIVMGKGHGIVWYSGAGASTSAIYCNGTNFNQGTTLNFTDGAVTFGNSSSSKNVFRIANIGAVSANHPGVSNSASGNPVQFLAYGSDANIDIQLVPQGTGVVWLGVRTASVDAAVNGYITVKDSTGVIRKLATIA